jgi:hypothetical protein
MSKGPTHQERHEHETDTHPEQNRAQNRNIPRYVCILAGPSQPEHTDDQRRSSEHASVKPVFGRREALPLLHYGGIEVPGGEDDVNECTEGATDPDANEHEASHGHGHAPLFVENNGKCL